MDDTVKEVEILLVEDNPTDAELAKTVSELGRYWLLVNHPPVEAK